MVKPGRQNRPHSLRLVPGPETPDSMTRYLYDDTEVGVPITGLVCNLN